MNSNANLKSLLLVGCVLLFGIGSAVAQEERIDLKGRVVDSKGAPVKFAKVVLLYKSWIGGYRQRVLVAKTDMSGSFSFPKRFARGERNAFLLTVFANGLAFDSRYVRNLAGEPLDPIKVVLQPAIPKSFTVLVNGQPESKAQIVPLARIDRDGKEHFIYHQASAQAVVQCDSKGKIELPYFQRGDTAKFKLINSEISKTVQVKIDANASQVINFSSADHTRAVVSKRWTPAPAKVDAKLVNVIRSNSIKFRTIDPKDEKFEDLQPLKKLIGDARIVQLGEQSHGDGTCFLTKVRLIKFLHQEMGFDVIAFESGIYDCSKAWQALNKPNTPVDAAKLGVFGIWTGSKQTAELWRYISDTVVTRRPLELAGFDCQFTGLGSKRHLVDELRSVLATEKLGIDKGESEYFVLQINSLIKGVQPSGDLERLEAVSAKVIAKLTDDLTLPTQDASFWRQQFKSITALAKYRWKTKKEKPSQLSINQRDLQMAKNLIWLSHEKYRGRKIIVWAANFHIARNLKEIEVPDKSVNYDRITPMGHHIYRRLADQTYTIGFTAYEGKAGAYFRQPFEVKQAPAGTFEDLCVRAGLVNGLVPLSNPTTGVPLTSQAIPGRPLGYAWMKAKWGDHFDALIINKTMAPSTR